MKAFKRLNSNAKISDNSKSGFLSVMNMYMFNRREKTHVADDNCKTKMLATGKRLEVIFYTRYIIALGTKAMTMLQLL